MFAHLPSQEFSCLSVPNPHSVFPHRDPFPATEDYALKSDRDILLKEIVPYVPLNYINNEAYALLAAYEAQAAHHEVSDNVGESMDLVVLSTSNMYEPERIMRRLAPPKRFYRTYWRSISRRMLDRELDSSMMQE